jgi:glycosyltransferase involved in cell wall biosynthesis
MTDKLQLLCVLPYPPVPVTTGGKRRILALLRRVASRHDVYLHCSLRAESERAALHELRDVCRGIVAVTRGGKWSLRAAGTWLAQGRPYLAALNDGGGSVADSIRRAYAGRRFDCLHVEHYYMMEPVLSALSHSAPVLLGEQGIEYLVASRHGDRRSGAAGLLWRKEVRQTRTWEERAWRQADRVVVVSEDDRRVVLTAAPGTGVGVVPNAVELGDFPFVCREGTVSPTVVFVGTFRFFGNVEAAQWLVRSVMPRVRNDVPSARLVLVGEEPPTDLRASESWVSVQGWVPSISEALREAAVMAVPLRTGSGTKLKVLEAMALGLPVVTTPLGVEGIRAEHGTHVLVGEDAPSFAGALVKVLTSPRLRGEIGRAARSLVEEHFSWDRAAESLDENYVAAINGFADRRSHVRATTI